MTAPVYPGLRPWNALIGWPRCTDNVQWLGGVWRPEYPVTNSRSALYLETTRDLSLGYVARSADLAPTSTRLVGMLPRLTRIGLIVAVAHNWSVSAQWRVRVFADEAGALLVWEKPRGDVWGIAYPPGTLEWEDENFWTGAFSSTELAGLSWNAPLLIDPAVMGRRIEIDIWDELNPSGFVQHGLIEVAKAMRLPLNFSYGADSGFRSRSLQIEAESGAIFPERRAKPRIFQGSIDLAPEAWASTDFFEFQRWADTTEPFWWWMRPDDVLETHRSAALMRNATLGLQKLVHYRRRTLPLNFLEVL
jgi:hypothetical protein